MEVLQEPKQTAFKMSESIDQLAAALALAQSELKPAKFDCVNPHFKSKYASLASVLDAAKPLHKHGLAVIQLPTGADGLVTILAHKSGQYVSCEFHIKPSRMDAHGIGSTLTYLKRYCYSAVTGICADEDDDGNEATGLGSKPKATAQRSPSLPAASKAESAITDEMTMNIRKTLYKIGYSSEAALTEALGFWPPANDEQWKEAAKLAKVKV